MNTYIVNIPSSSNYSFSMAGWGSADCGLFSESSAGGSVLTTSPFVGFSVLGLVVAVDSAASDSSAII